ncbi:MAG TPA: S24 family peptidase [Candidatus Saccharimonadales bacterium]|nr:S24 family peptidase [Candidatus Saccharimonadales bacterium]
MEEDFTDLAGSDGVSIHAGFPNPGVDQRGRGRPLALDLNQLLVRRPSSTYLFRISGHNWADQGVYDGDVAIVDRAQGRGANDLVVTWRASGFALCRRRQLAGDDESLGVVTAIIHRFSEA